MKTRTAVIEEVLHDFELYSSTGTDIGDGPRETIAVAVSMALARWECEWPKDWQVAEARDLLNLALTPAAGPPNPTPEEV